jgi:hypothetical protein
MATKKNKSSAKAETKIEAPPKAEKPKKKGSSKAALIKQLEAKDMYIPNNASATELKHILDTHRSNLYWLVRLVGSTYQHLIDLGIDNRKTVYALPDTEHSIKILNSRRLVVLKRTAKPFSNAVIIDSFTGDDDGSNN